MTSSVGLNLGADRLLRSSQLLTIWTSSLQRFDRFAKPRLALLRQRILLQDALSQSWIRSPVRNCDELSLLLPLKSSTWTLFQHSFFKNSSTSFFLSLQSSVTALSKRAYFLRHRRSSSLFLFRNAKDWTCLIRPTLGLSRTYHLFLK